MARQVYYDPYGVRTNAYDTGLQREMSLQDQTRRARASDYDYFVNEPLRLAHAQREDTYAQAALPYRQRALGLSERAAQGNLYDAEMGRAMNYGELRADYSPAIANQDLYFSGQYANAPQYLAPYSEHIRQTIDQSPFMQSASQLAQSFGIDPQVFMQALNQMIGRFSPQTEQSMDQYQTWDRTRQLAQDQFGITQQRAGMETAAQNAATNAANAQSLMYDRYYNRGNQPAVMGEVDEDGLPY